MRGDVCDLHLCSWKTPPPPPSKEPKKLSRWDILAEDDEPGEKTIQAVVKVCRNVGDADLAKNEVAVLDDLYPPEQTDEKFYRYLVKPLAREPYLVMPYLDEYVTVEEVIKAFPGGLDFRDVTWMFKRLLIGLGFVHNRKVIHGAVVPPHVMIHPTEHGAKLIDWSYAVRRNTTIKAYPAVWRAYYPPEVFDKRFPTAATDIYMAAKIAVALLGGSIETNELPKEVPAEVAGLLRSCLGELPSSRPQDAWELHDEFDGIIQKLVGKPKYRKLKMP